MKKIIFFLLSSLFFFGSLKAQKEMLGTRMFFPDSIAAERALLSGDFRFYIPDPDNLKMKPPKLAKGLPGIFIALEEVREYGGKSPAWVILPPGMPAEFNSDGMPNLDGRCWNTIHRAYLFEKYVSLSQIEKLRGPKGDKGDQGRDGKKGKDGHDGESFNPPTSSFLKDWGASIVGGILTGIAAGYAFPEKNTFETLGKGSQAGDGTIQYGPSKIETITKFNWKNAGIGFILGTVTFKIVL